MNLSMPASPLPPSLEQLGQRSFSFYPPILNIQHNEWRFHKATWSELLVANTKTGEEIWIPRRFVGELSRVEEPVMILGLLKELEFVAGQVLPHARRVIEMPRAVNDVFPRTETVSPEPKTAPVVGIRLDSAAEKRIGRLILGVLGFIMIAGVLAVGLFRDRRDARVNFKPVIQSDLNLTAQSDYHDVIRQLGQPAQDQWRSEEGERQYRVLRYPDRSISVILMGPERESVKYIGAVNPQWRPVHAVTLPGGSSTFPILRSLKPF